MISALKLILQLLMLMGGVVGVFYSVIIFSLGDFKQSVLMFLMGLFLISIFVSMIFDDA